MSLNDHLARLRATIGTSDNPHPYRAPGYSVQPAFRQRRVLDAGVGARFLNTQQLDQGQLPTRPQWGLEPACERYARDVDSTINDDPANFYGRFIALGYTHMTEEGGHRERNSVFNLWRRREANGWVVEYNNRMVAAHQPQPQRLVTEQQRSTARTEIRQMSSIGERSDSAAFRSPAPSSTTGDLIERQFVRSPHHDLFQFGRDTYSNDFIIKGDEYSEQNAFSRLSFRVQCRRPTAVGGEGGEEEASVRIYAAGFDDSNEIFLGQHAPRWNDADGNLDGGITAGLYVWHPEVKRWFEVSVFGSLVEPRRSSYYGLGLPAQVWHDGRRLSNKLVDGCIIRNHNVVLYYTTLSPGADGSLSQDNLTSYYQSLAHETCPIDLEPMNFGQVVMSVAQPAYPVTTVQRYERLIVERQRRAQMMVAEYTHQTRPTLADETDPSHNLQSMSIGQPSLQRTYEHVSSDIAPLQDDAVTNDFQAVQRENAGNTVSAPDETAQELDLPQGEQRAGHPQAVNATTEESAPSVPVSPFSHTADTVQTADAGHDEVIAIEAGQEVPSAAESQEVEAALAEMLPGTVESARAGVFPKCGHVFTLLPPHLRSTIRTCPLCRRAGQMVSLVIQSAPTLCPSIPDLVLECGHAICGSVLDKFAQIPLPTRQDNDTWVPPRHTSTPMRSFSLHRCPFCGIGSNFHTAARLILPAPEVASDQPDTAAVEETHIVEQPDQL